MKMYISDLHIGIGDMKDDFVYDEKLVSVIDSREGKLNEIYIVGDFLELLAMPSERILCNTVEEYLEIFDYTYIDKIYDKHKILFDRLKEFSKENKIKYIVGNHDYHLLFSEKLRNLIKNIMGEVEFYPYYYDEEWKLFIMHGNQFDKLNRLSMDTNGKIIPTFGEYMAKFMENTFNMELVKFLPEETVADYDNVRPNLDVFKWLKYVDDKFNIKVNLNNIWNDEFVNFIRTQETKRWIKINYPKASVLTNVFINKVGGMKFGETLVRTVMNFRTVKKTDHLLRCSKKLLTEKFFIPKNIMIGYTNSDISYPLEKINGLILGHNHRPSYNIMSHSKHKRFYANTGAWKHVVARNFGIDKHEFVKKGTLSYLTLEESETKELIAKMHIEDIY